MEASVSSSSSILMTSTTPSPSSSITLFGSNNISKYASFNRRRRRRRCNNLSMKNPSTKKDWRIAAAINDVSAVADPAPAVLTWQIVVGAIAGVTPFVVAGIEFSKRIIAQRRCEVCGGSGLVLKKDNYMRCPGCGGFLPWQSWKRFFSG